MAERQCGVQMKLEALRLFKAVGRQEALLIFCKRTILQILTPSRRLNRDARPAFALHTLFSLPQRRFN